MTKICYWTVADGQYAHMAHTLGMSLRNAGVKEDFYVYTDNNQIHYDGINWMIMDKIHRDGLYMFKFDFLKTHVKKLDYDYYVFLDADNYCVREIPSIIDLIGDSPIHAFLESDCTNPQNKRPDWWGCPLNEYVRLMREMGVIDKRVYNVNAGFWVVKREAVDTVFRLAADFWHFANNNGYRFTEEAPLAYVTHMLTADAERHTMRANSKYWASDWTGNYADAIPDGKEWEFTDYMTGEPYKVNPAVVHAMRSKNAFVRQSKINVQSPALIEKAKQNQKDTSKASPSNDKNTSKVSPLDGPEISELLEKEVKSINNKNISKAPLLDGPEISELLEKEVRRRTTKTKEPEKLDVQRKIPGKKRR